MVQTKGSEKKILNNLFVAEKYGSNKLRGHRTDVFTS